MRVIFLTGPLAGNKYKTHGELIVGRDVSCDIVIPEPLVSLIHCQISYDNRSAAVKDLGSTNGTFVNDKRIVHAEIENGDCVTIGKSRIRVEILESDESAEEVPVASAPTIVATATGEKMSGRHDSAAPDVDELSGSIFGEVTYFFIRKIADGGMGAVYEAEQYGAEGFIKKVAIKTILPHYAKRERFVSSFVGEAKLVANLVHENIVQIHHLGRHEDGYYIAMEYIDGTSLSDLTMKHLKKRVLPPSDMATFVVSRVCRGLEYAHNKRDDSGKMLKLVHRDVSPNNIMITREGEVKLTDFGVAKAAQFMDDDGTYLVGSVEYMSPEQASCAPVDARSDLFSLGLVYYELLTGRRIFQCLNDNVEDTLERVKAAIIPDPRMYRPDLPEGMFRILMKCLEKRPEQRYQSAGELGNALEHEMYSKGLGPTILSLSKYINNFA